MHESGKIKSVVYELMKENKINSGFNNARHIKLRKDEERYNQIIIDKNLSYFYHKAKYPIACNSLILEREKSDSL